ncbi:hypothetical protein K438DRAFT_2121427 [Mycena galopus ATCC 62051]|nr:hypothetical protein K438DRAFT_2121427 [Mycena galopus ATCC 62051]
MPYNEAREGSWWCGLRRAEGKCKEEPAPIRTPIPPLASPSTDTGTRIRTHPAPYGGMEVTLKQRCEDVCNTEIKMTKRAQRRMDGAQYCPRPPLCLASKVQYWYKNVSASGVLYGPLSVKSNYRTIAPSSRVIPAAQQADPCEEPTRTRAPRILCAQTTPEAHLKLVACVLTPEPLTRRRWALSSRWVSPPHASYASRVVALRTVQNSPAAAPVQPRGHTQPLFYRPSAVRRVPTLNAREERRNTERLARHDRMHAQARK